MRIIFSWSTDEEFGRQLLNGVNPISISLCKEILPQFAQVEKEIFQNGTSFKSEIEVSKHLEEFFLL